MNQPHTQRVGVALRRSHIVKILRRARKIGRRNVRQQRFCRGAERCRINHVSGKRLARHWIVDRDGHSVLVRQSGKIAAPFCQRRHGAEGIERGASSRPIPAEVVKRFVPVIENVRDFQGAPDHRAKANLVIAGLVRIMARQRIRARIQRGIVVTEIQETVRLIQVEAAPPSSDPHWPATRAASARASAKSSKRACALALRLFAKLLNTLLNFVFVARSKILRATLRPRNRKRFCRTFRSRAVHRQTSQIACAGAAICLAHTPRLCRRILYPQILKASAARRGRARLIGLFRLSRSQQKLRFHFARGVLRIQHHFLRQRGESHELHFHHISSARQSLQRERSIHAACRTRFFPRERVRRRHRDSRQRRLSTLHRPPNLITGRSWRGRRFLPARQAYEQNRADQREAQRHQQCAGRTLQFGCSCVFGAAPAGGASTPCAPRSCMRFHCSGPITNTFFGTNISFSTAPRAIR